MHKLICFEGINYVGKTSVAKIVGTQIGVLYGPHVATKYVRKEEEIHKNPDHLLTREPVILDRYFLSVLAYHNVIIGRHLEEETDTSKIHKPDITFLLIVDKVTLRNRMVMRPPQHPYESDPAFLLRVQKEFLRLMDKGTSIIIDTSVRTAEETAVIVARELGKCGFIIPRSIPNEEI